MIPGSSLVLITIVVALILAALMNFVVSRVWRRPAIRWPRFVTLVTLATLLCWVLVALVALVAFSLKALGFHPILRAGARIEVDTRSWHRRGWGEPPPSRAAEAPIIQSCWPWPPTSRQ